MRLINQTSRVFLSPKDVYTFRMKLCDNEIDRDFERFTPETLSELAKLFIGKCSVSIPDWNNNYWTSRIYRTELIQMNSQNTKAEDSYCSLHGWAYMVRTPGNASIIDEIEGGIKKEVSVGCSVERAVCSICGEEVDKCAHVKGKRYGGKLCWKNLVGATDAFEWSFVATPIYAGAIGRDGTELWRQRMQ